MSRRFKLFGLGAALAVLTLAAGNNGQVAAQTPAVGGYPFSGTRVVYNVLGNVDWPSVIIQVGTDDYNAAQVQTWTGNGWSNVGTPIPAGSVQVRSPNSPPSALMIQSQGGGLFWVGATSWGNRTFAAQSGRKFKSGGGGQQCDAEYWRGSDDPNLAWIVALFHWKNSKYSTRLTVQIGYTTVEVPPRSGLCLRRSAPFYYTGLPESRRPRWFVDRRGDIPELAVNGPRSDNLGEEWCCSLGD